MGRMLQDLGASGVGSKVWVLETILCKFGQICATGNAFVRLTPITKMHLLLGSRSERGGARRAPTKRVLLKRPEDFR